MNDQHKKSVNKLFFKSLKKIKMSSTAQQKEELADDVRPWDPEAKKCVHWHEDSIEDSFGRYPFAKYP